MLYEASLRELPPGFTEYRSELEIPPAHRAKWGEHTTLPVTLLQAAQWRYYL